MNNAELEDLLGRQEDLDPELEDCVFDDGPFGPSIKHPLVYSICHSPVTNALVNRQFRYKKEALARAADQQNWHSYVYLHERPYRLDAFMDIRDAIAKAEDYWRLLGSIWVDSENIWQNAQEWRDLFEEPERGSMEHFMDEDDRKALTLPPSKGGLLPTFTVYRGYHYEGGEDGFSWTLDKPRAKWFARRLCGDDEVPMVATGTLGRKDVIGYMTGRGEQEIVALPENVCAISVEEVDRGNKSPGSGLADHYVDEAGRRGE